MHGLPGRTLAAGQEIAMLREVVQPELELLIEQRNFPALKQALNEMDLHDVVEVLNEMPGKELGVAFRLLQRDRAAEVFGDLDIEQKEELLNVLTSERVADIINEMPPDERTEMLEELPGQLAQRLLSSLKGDELRIARSLLAYPEESVGRLMTPEYVAVRPDWPLEKVMRHIRRVGPKKETLNVIYVVDDNWRLLDEIRLEDIVLADPATQVRELMDEHYAALSAWDDRESAIELFKKYDVVALPVVNSEEILVGIVTIDDVLDVAEEETTEDFQKMVAIEALEGGYFQTSYFNMIRKRLPWLMLLLAGEILTVASLKNFDARLIAMLAFFMPLINATAGNTGTQMAGLMIRGLALQEMDVGDWLRVFRTELLRGLTLGAILGGLVGLIVLAFGEPQTIAVSVSVAMITAVTFANIMGSTLPFLFKRIGVDPAVTSGPFIASIMDVASVLIYFSIATALVG